MQPTYYVRHPDDTYSAAEPQPAESLANAAISALSQLGRMVGNSEHENNRIHAALAAAFSECASLATPADAGAGQQPEEQVEFPHSYRKWDLKREDYVAPPFAAPASQHEAIAGAVARGWCAPANENKVMDEELAFAIVTEVEKLLASGFCEGRNTKPESSDNFPAPVTAEPVAKFDEKHFHKLVMNVSNASYRCGKHANDEDGAIDLHHEANEADQAIIDYAQSVFATPAPADRDAILEDAALQCEAEKVHVQKWHPSSDGDEAYNAGCDDCAKSIRALKSMERAADAAETRDVKGDA